MRSGDNERLEGSPDALDMLDYSRATQAVTLNLASDSFKTGIDVVDGSPFDDQLTAGAAAVTLNGGRGNDRLQGGSGDDTLNGGEGLDLLLASGARGAYTLTHLAQGFELAARSGSDGRDSLLGIERITFADGGLALDLDGHAGEVARLLGAVYGREAVANARYAGIGLAFADGGMSFEDLAALALREAGATTPHDIVTRLWTNVVGSATTAQGADPRAALLRRPHLRREGGRDAAVGVGHRR